MKKILLAAFLFLAFAFVLSAKAQAVSYPIKELGDCRNAQECRYYCDTPENKPACWSYGKYILHKDVLGETTKKVTGKPGIVFPIAELGNCTTARSCKAYCEQKENREACKSFGIRKGLIKQKDKEKEKEGILIYAKKELGCRDQNSCRAFCEKTENRTKCEEFAKKRGLGQGQKAEMQKERMSSGSGIPSALKEKLGCDSKEACEKLCKQNPEKCQRYKNDLEKKKMQDARLLEKKKLKTCATERECYQVCREHPEKCPGFLNQQKFNSSQSGTYQKPTYPPKPTYVKPTEYVKEEWVEPINEPTEYIEPVENSEETPDYNY